MSRDFDGNTPPPPEEEQEEAMDLSGLLPGAAVVDEWRDGQEIPSK